MYPSHKKLEKYGELYEGDVHARPLIMVEYAHAMGNSLGAFKEYWDVIYKYDVTQSQPSVAPVARRNSRTLALGLPAKLREFSYEGRGGRHQEP